MFDTLIAELRKIAAELTGATTDAEEQEAVRAFLATCATYGIYAENAELGKAELLVECLNDGAPFPLFPSRGRP